MSRRLDSNNDYKNHKEKCEAKHNLTGHPKADTLYHLAWEMGHACGYYEVENYYDDMAILLKPNE